MNSPPLRVLVIGAGSMGSRRLRDLADCGEVTLAVYDQRADRRQRARQRFGVIDFADWPAALAWRPEALVISTPPDCHAEYVDAALELGVHHFCEAHLWTPDARRVEAESRRRGVAAACSCSMHFLPVVRRLTQVVCELGTLHAYQMFLSTWLPSWHPWEQGEFYAWRPSTAAAREMVPFELAYLNDVFGDAVAVAGSVVRRGSLALEGPDTWCLQMQLADGAVAQLTLLMGSPASTRRGCCFSDRGSAQFDIDSGEILVDRGEGPVERIACGALADVLEPAYRDEIRTFIDAVQGRTQWPHPYSRSAQATATLAAAERSAAAGDWQRVEPELQPEHLPARK